MRLKLETMTCGCEVRSARKYEEKFKCNSCLEYFCGKHIFQKVDENNITITKNHSTRLKCKNCFNKII